MRDLASGLAIALCSAPSRARTALRARALFDGLDVAGFGTLSPLPSGRAKVAAAGTAWGVAALALARANGAAATGER